MKNNLLYDEILDYLKSIALSDKPKRFSYYRILNHFLSYTVEDIRNMINELHSKAILTAFTNDYNIVEVEVHPEVIYK